MRLNRRTFGLAVLGAAVAPTARAQSVEPVSTWETSFHEGRYLPTYLELKGRSDVGDRAPRQELVQWAAFLGDEATALGLTDATPDPEAALPDLSGATVEDALDAIVQGARDTRLVILNEAHWVSGHRGFATRVMRALRAEGYDWLAAEAFSNSGGMVAGIEDYRAGEVFRSALGHYTQDPVYAELVREAAERGYRMVSYEQREDQLAADDAPRDAVIAARERAQAENLAAVLAAHPAARMLVLVGHGHVIETGEGEARMFAGRLEALTGINPLTIDQSRNWPAWTPANDLPHVRAVLDRFAPEAPVVVRVADRVVGAPGYEGRTDLSVFHPRLATVSGRPGWLASDPERHAVEVALPEVVGPALLQAVPAMEGGGAIPADQVLLETGQRAVMLLLRRGRYFLRMETPDGIGPAFGVVDVGT